MALRIGGYARVSLDKADDEKGIDRQREHYERHVSVRPGWTVVCHYIDNDLSAYRKNVARPEFERLLMDLRDGVIDGVVAYDLDRLARQPRDLERLIDIYEDRPNLIFATVTNDINLSSPDGRTMARVLVTMANKASADASRRVARKHRQLADEGRNGGGHRAFGWKEDRVTVEPYEAGLILKAHDDLLAGTRLNTVVREWQALEVRTARRTAAPISRTAVRSILTNPRLCGYRAVNGAVHYGPNGMPVIGEWEPITTPEKFEAVRLVLEDITQRYKDRTRNGTNSHRYLLSGILRCSECGSRMMPNLRSSWQPGGKGSRFFYRCPASTDGGCGKVSRAGEPVERHIVGLVQEAETLLARRPSGRFSTEWPGKARLAEVESEIVAYIQAKKDKGITAPTLITLLEPLEAERESLKYERARFLADKARAEDTGCTAKDFARLPIERQRAVVMKHIKAVIVHPAGRGARTFDPALLEVVRNTDV
ncbi:recombinase family protein [Streptomyces sp. NPDC050315]|uniref:recombinase family protein n=1 Tax=Streptomyces sp. NPDC050315 TaxID=3155039 RepID=UPI0034412BB6